MRLFSALFRALDETTSTNRRIDALVRYFEAADESDQLWCVALFFGRRPKRPVNTAELRTWAAELAGYPSWLFEDTYHVVGDLAETVAHLVPPASEASDAGLSLTDQIAEIKAMHGQPVERRREWVVDSWNRMSHQERFVFNKLMTGGFRVGVSQKTMVKALARFTGQAEASVSHRLMGEWTPEDTTIAELLLGERTSDQRSKPYPFYLAYALEGDPSELGNFEEWQAEYKWDGIRGQLIRRGGEVFVWSRGEELITGRYPELQSVGQVLPDGVVLDGEIMCHDGTQPLSFGLLQKRIGKKSAGKKLLAEAPVRFMAYDLMEWAGEDWRDRPFQERRATLQRCVTDAAHDHLLLSKALHASGWKDWTEAREVSRAHRAEGLMLKRISAPYGVGRRKGDMWKWKMDPLSIDSVLMYAMRGHGRRANLYTDYTFGVWDGDALVPFTKAYSGLTDAEFKRVDAFVKKNTLERFGPVRSVPPALVFEVHFEGIAASSRHKSGVSLRFPRMHRWREDKPASEANTLADLNLLLELYG